MASILSFSGLRSFLDSMGNRKKSSFWICCTYTAAVALRLALVPTAHSEDFEVHRNWLAVTYSRPVSEWYTEATSKWTLDYPPLFAYFQRLLASLAVHVDPEMIKISKEPYSSLATIWFQRLTVILSEVVLLVGVLSVASPLNFGNETAPEGGSVVSTCVHTGKNEIAERCLKAAEGRGAKEVEEHDEERKQPRTSTEGSFFDPRLFAILCVMFDSGLIIVDHIHFQYNGFLLGILLLSVSSIVKGRVFLGSFLFTCLLLLKHIFLYVSPVIGVFLLGSYCWRLPKAGDKQWERHVPQNLERGGDRSTSLMRECCHCRNGGARHSPRTGFKQTNAERLTEDADENHTTEREGIRKRKPEVPKERQDRKPRRESADEGQTKDKRSSSPWFWSFLSLLRERFNLGRLTQLCCVVIVTVSTCLAPFACTSGFKSMMHRLFPFQRGLTHAYWAPNVWALYLFVDRLMFTVRKWVQPDTIPQTMEPTAVSPTSGLAMVTATTSLPGVGPFTCFLLTTVLYVPLLIATWQLAMAHSADEANHESTKGCSTQSRRLPKEQLLAALVALGSAAAFACGWHVHEKAILYTTIPFGACVWGLRDTSIVRLYFWLQTVSNFSLLPLLSSSTASSVCLKYGIFVCCTFLSGFLNYIYTSDILPMLAGGPLRLRTFFPGCSWLRSFVFPSFGSCNTTPQASQKTAFVSKKNGSYNSLQQMVNDSGGQPWNSAYNYFCVFFLPIGLPAIAAYDIWGYRTPLGSSYPFLRLMLISVYCFIGIFTSVGGIYVRLGALIKNSSQ